MSKNKKPSMRDCIGTCDGPAPADRIICGPCRTLLPVDLQEDLTSALRPGKAVDMPALLRTINDVRGFFWRQRNGAPTFDVLAAGEVSGAAVRHG